MRPAALLLVAVVLLSSAVAEAVTYNVPSIETPTIGAAIGAAQDGDTILVAPGTYFESGYEILQHNLLIQGTTGVPADVVIDAQFLDRVFDIHETNGVVVRNMTFRHGFADPWFQEAGGAVRLTVHAEALIENCAFEGDSAGAGGAISLEPYCTGTIRKCVFRDNRAAATGGAFYSDGATVFLDSCLFELNRAGNGGALYCEPCSLYATGARFLNNTAEGNAGALSLRNSYAELQDCRFEENTAGYWGGGLFSDSSTVLATGPFFTQNAALRGGGAYFYHQSAGAIQDGNFTHNRALGAGGGGGAIFLHESHPEIAYTNLWYNTTEGRGGAMTILDAVPDRVESCSFQWNHGELGGGAVLIDGNGNDPNVGFLRCLFAANESPGGAGAIDVQNGAGLSLSSCTIVENDPMDADGAAIGGEDSPSCGLDRCIVAFSVTGIPVAVGSFGSLDVSCTDAYGNAGGDWVGPLESFDSLNGNFEADPMFCGNGTDDPYALQFTSPCVTDACDLVGARGVGCGFEKNWIGIGDGLNWEDPENWSPYGVPGPSDDVYLTLLDQFEVWLSSPAAVYRLTVGGPGSYCGFHIAADTLTVTHGGENAALVTLHEGAALRLTSGSAFVNLPNAVVTLEGGDLTGEGVFVNGSEVAKWNPATASRIAVAFENRVDDPGDGVLTIHEGVVEIEGPFTNSGNIYVYEAAAMLLDPGDGPLRTEVLTNWGYVLVETGAAIDLATPTTVFLNMGPGTVELQGGDITGAGIFRNYGLLWKTDPLPLSRALSHVSARLENLVDDPGDGAVRVEDGILSIEEPCQNDGSLYVYTESAMRLDPGDGPLREEYLSNTNVVIIQDGAALEILGPTTVFKNAYGGLVKLQGTGEILGDGVFHNYGSFWKEDPAKGRALGHIEVAFDNLTSDPGDGALHVYDGTLWMEGEVTNAGMVVVDEGAGMLLDPGEGPLRREDGGGGARTEGLATNEVGATWFAAGTLVVADMASFANEGRLVITATGTVENEGAFDLRENSVLEGRGTFDNTAGSFTGAGVIRPARDIGTLTFLGNFSQTPTGEIEVEIGGTDPGTGYDRFEISGNAALDGAMYVELVGGFVPAEGDSFAVITSGGALARTSFDCFSGLDLPGDLSLDPVEEANLLALVARAEGSTNAPPVAGDDFDSTNATTPIILRVLTNDMDPDADPLRVALVSADGTIGSVAILPGDTLLLYTPVRAFSGRDSFTYTVTDCRGGSDVATATIGVARAPRAWFVPSDDAPTIAAGLGAAWAGDTVVVASGTYHEHDIVMKSGVVLRSETLDPMSVVIDADSLGRVLYCNLLDGTTSVVGITFTGGSAMYGGGAGVWNSAVVFDRCIFRGNVALGASEYGGGLFLNAGSPVVRRCLLEANQAQFGGALAITAAASTALIESTVVAANLAVGAGAAANVQSGAHPAFRSCTIAGNSCPSGSGGFNVAGPTLPTEVELENSILASNTSGPMSNVAWCGTYGAVVSSCCDIYGNSGDDFIGCLAGQQGANGNFSEDPRFCQVGNPADRFALMIGSPCAPENNPACGLVGARPVGCGAVTGVEDAAPPALQHRLFANRPNPFNPTTTIRFSLPRAERATLVVYDIAGRRVATLADGVSGPGELEVVWHGTDSAGREVASGAYFVRLVAGEFTAVRKMILIR